nr:uncharacterized protein c19a8.11c [Quercus suber]
MDVNHSRRVLAIVLTGSKPTLNESGTTAGLIHEWNIKTAYYSANVSIWIDEVPDVVAWEAEFTKSEAQEVIEALGAWIYCFRRPAAGEHVAAVEQTMNVIQKIAEKHAGLGAEVCMLAVAVPDGTVASPGSTTSNEDWEDIALRYGFEFIDSSATGKNEFGERVGLERMREALEANEWSYTGADDEVEINIDDLDITTDDTAGLGRDEAEMTAEIFGMKAALMRNDDQQPEAEDFTPSAESQAHEVDDLDRIMSRILAIKESSAELPEAQRKKMASQAKQLTKGTLYACDIFGQNVRHNGSVMFALAVEMRRYPTERHDWSHLVKDRV